MTASLERRRFLGLAGGVAVFAAAPIAPAQYIAGQIDKWTKVVAFAGIKVN